MKIVLYQNVSTFLIIAIVDKKSPWLHYNKRIIKLYTTPKLDYIDFKTNKVKGTIFLDENSYSKSTDDYNFELITKHRIYYFRLYEKSSNFWVNTINQTIKTFVNKKK